ncbi:MAG: type II toxin-antitoxin system PemK/MazF family toxin [Caldilineaceae bacterium]
MPISQGDIYWLHAAGSGGATVDYAHPYVVVQDDVINQSRVKTVVVCALTSNRNRMTEPGNVLLDAGEANLPKQSVVVVSQVEAVEKTEMGEYIGTLSRQRIEQIFAGMRFQQRAFFARDHG